MGRQQLINTSTELDFVEKIGFAFGTLGKQSFIFVRLKSARLVLVVAGEPRVLSIDSFISNS
jgi:hypothetical protein